jgi:molecular chaperone DnaK (HSP70)
MDIYCIDFGTTNTVISYLNNDETIQYVMEPNTGEILIPSTIYFLNENINNDTKVLEYGTHYLIGNSADDNYDMYKNDFSYFYQFKRMLGITTKSNINDLDVLKQFNLKYELNEENIYFFIQTNEEDKYIKLSIIELIGLYLKGIHKWINNEKIKTYITHPAYFNDKQKSQLKQSFENANFEVLKSYNEPTSASIYYIYKYYKEIKSGSIKFLIFDIGGGTTDVSVIEYDFENNICNVLDVDGNNMLGGCDIDNVITQHIYETYNIDKNNTKWKTKVKKCAEIIKKKLTYIDNFNIIFENVPVIENGKIIIKELLEIKFNVSLFNYLIQNIITQMINLLKTMTEKHVIQDIIFIGGTTQIPNLNKQILNIINTKNDDRFLYKTIVSNGLTIINKIIKNNENFYILDIVPMDIFIKTDNFFCVINKNSKIPTTKKYILTTSRDAQRSIDIEIYEGENKYHLATYTIVNIPVVKKGDILIELLFSISNTGLLSVKINGSLNKQNNANGNFELNKEIKLLSNTTIKNLLKKLKN